MGEWDSERKVAERIGVPTARRHIFLCAEQTTPKCWFVSRDFLFPWKWGI